MAQKTKKTTLGKSRSIRLQKRAHWYVLNTQPGQEKKVIRAIKERIKATELKDQIQELFVPTQKKIDIKEGEQNITDERIFPGYILIKMKLTAKTWELVKNTENVRGFVKTDKYPRPLPKKEVQAIQKFMKVEQPAFKINFGVGEAVKITDGVFEDYIGSVQEIDEENGKLTVLVSFLGREAPYELDLNQVEKL